MEESLQEETLSEWLTTPGNPEKAWKKNNSAKSLVRPGNSIGRCRNLKSS